jgi:hypothetical protein
MNQNPSEVEPTPNPEIPQQAVPVKNAPAKEAPKKKKNKNIQKEAKAIGNKVLDEGKEFGNQAKDIVLGTGRQQEIKNLRLKKLERNKEVYLER